MNRNSATRSHLDGEVCSGVGSGESPSRTIAEPCIGTLIRIPYGQPPQGCPHAPGSPAGGWRGGVCPEEPTPHDGQRLGASAAARAAARENPHQRAMEVEPIAERMPMCHGLQRLIGAEFTDVQSLTINAFRLSSMRAWVSNSRFSSGRTRSSRAARSGCRCCPWQRSEAWRECRARDDCGRNQHPC